MKTRQEDDIIILESSDSTISFESSNSRQKEKNLSSSSFSPHKETPLHSKLKAYETEISSLKLRVTDLQCQTNDLELQIKKNTQMKIDFLNEQKKIYSTSKRHGEFTSTLL